MSTTAKIEIFDRICVSLFDKLYSEFPVPVDINMQDVVMSVVPEDASFDSTWDALSVSDGVVSFLADEGFLKYSGTMIMGVPNFTEVRLTMKGLAVLGYIPFEKKEPPISTIRKMVQGGMKDAGKETIRNVVSQVFSLVLTTSVTAG